MPKQTKTLMKTTEKLTNSPKSTSTITTTSNTKSYKTPMKKHSSPTKRASPTKQVSPGSSSKTRLKGNHLRMPRGKLINLPADTPTHCQGTQTDYSKSLLAAPKITKKFRQKLFPPPDLKKKLDEAMAKPKSQREKLSSILLSALAESRGKTTFSTPSPIINGSTNKTPPSTSISNSTIRTEVVNKTPPPIITKTTNKTPPPNPTSSTSISTSTSTIRTKVVKKTPIPAIIKAKDKRKKTLNRKQKVNFKEYQVAVTKVMHQPVQFTTDKLKTKFGGRSGKKPICPTVFKSGKGKEYILSRTKALKCQKEVLNALNVISQGVIKAVAESLYIGLWYAKEKKVGGKEIIQEVEEVEADKSKKKKVVVNSDISVKSRKRILSHLMDNALSDCGLKYVFPVSSINQTHSVKERKSDVSI